LEKQHNFGHLKVVCFSQGDILGGVDKFTTMYVKFLEDFGQEV